MEWLVILLALYVLICVIRLTRFIHSQIRGWLALSHIPGPPLSSYSKLWQIVKQMQGNWYLELKAVGDQYGELFRIGPNQVITSDIDVIKRMAHPKSSYTRGSFYQTFRFIHTQDSSFSLLDDEEHSRRRTKLGPGYTGQKHVEDVIDRQCVRMTDLIERKYVSTAKEFNPLDLTALSFCFSMDCIGDLSFGGAFGCLDEGEDLYDFVKWNNSFFPVAIVISNLHWLTKIFFTPPFNTIYPSTRDKKGVGKYLSLAVDAVEKRFSQCMCSHKCKEQQRNDALGAFIEQGVTKEEAINELMLQVVAGTDSVGTAMRMTMLYLISSPTIYHKLQSEIDTAISNDLISYPIRDSEARALPYLQAVIKEGVRIFPVVTATFYKKVPEGGETVCGYHVPGGTEVGVNVLGIMRSKKYWGDDAEAFRPERWLEADAATLDVMSEALETLWGAGRYKCLGRAIAQMELNKMFVELLRRFDFAAVAPHNPVKIVNSGFFLMSELHLRVTRRFTPVPFLLSSDVPEREGMGAKYM